MNNIAEMFHKYKFDIETFIETGTFEGGGIEQAFDAGFTRAFSIEYNKSFYDYSLDKFRDSINVYLLHGSSADKLPDVLKYVGDEKCFFWLDAHDSFGTGGGIPMKEELAAIKAHSRNDHTIMIDDIPLYFGDGSELREILWDINPDYRIEMLDPGMPSRPDYCMVAYVQ